VHFFPYVINKDNYDGIFSPGSQWRKAMHDSKNPREGSIVLSKLGWYESGTPALHGEASAPPKPLPDFTCSLLLSNHF